MRTFCTHCMFGCSPIRKCLEMLDTDFYVPDRQLVCFQTLSFWKLKSWQALRFADNVDTTLWFVMMSYYQSRDAEYWHPRATVLQCKDVASLPSLVSFCCEKGWKQSVTLTLLGWVFMPPFQSMGISFLVICNLCFLYLWLNLSEIINAKCVPSLW